VLYSRGDRAGAEVREPTHEPLPEAARVSSAQEVSGLSRELRVNEMIRVPQVRVVDEEGNQAGVMQTGDALRLAQERGYDLVEVAPMASPPVVRFLDYGQFKYEQTRREKEARRHQRSVEFKEVRLTPKIGRGDVDTKVRRAVEFLEAGGRVKVSVRFRGRELTHAYLGRDLLMRFADRIKEHGSIERQPLLEGKSMSIVVASVHKPKPLPAPSGHGGHARPNGPDASEALAPAAGPAQGAAAQPTAPAQGSAATSTAPAQTPAPAQAGAPAPVMSPPAAEPAAPSQQAPSRPAADAAESPAKPAPASKSAPARKSAKPARSAPAKPAAAASQQASE
jgi:translation initiation factor IF-3